MPILAADDPSKAFLEGDLTHPSSVRRQGALATVRLYPQKQGRRGFDPASVGIDFGERVEILVAEA